MTPMTSRPSIKSHSRRSSHTKTSTTPYGPPPSRAPGSVGQSIPPLLTPNLKSPKSSHDARLSSPNYFGFVVESSNPSDSNSGEYARRHWDYPTSAGRVTTATPRAVPADANPNFEAFRRQSEANNKFNLSHTSLSSFSSSQSPSHIGTGTRPSPTSSQKRPIESPYSPTDRRGSPPRIKRDDGMDVDSDDSAPKSFFDVPRQDSPSSTSSGLTIPEIPSHRHSIPHNHPSSATSSADESLKLKQPIRAGTIPPSGIGAPSMASSDDLASLIRNNEVLLLDLRVYPQYAASRIRGALNLCIPTTLLKRPSFNVQKLLDTFTNQEDKKRFSKWRRYHHIVVYDASSSACKEAITPMHVLKKFVTEGWNGHPSILKGGFLEFSKAYPDLIDQADAQQSGGSGKQMLSLAAAPKVAPVAGGCPMPKAQSAANPFFGNIRQNMDLIGGVGQMSIKHPVNMTAHSEEAIPSWLRSAVDSDNEGKEVADKFLHIEQLEQKRMEKALSARVSYGEPRNNSKPDVQIAGIEKGSKNRYNNIFPYDHTRVKLQGIPDGGCDYVNANYVKASFSNKRYVATQAPVPATFADFWRVVWEQDVQVVVMLTAESEGGQVKSHPYWKAGEYGQLKLKSLSEQKIPLSDPPKSTPAYPAFRRPGIGQRRSTNPHTAAEKTQAKEEVASPAEPPSITVRHLTLSHAGFPFQPLREITQIQYSSWPDFGAPAHPKDLLNLIKHTEKYVRNTMKSGQTLQPEQPMPEHQRPVLVHCSAGCGRTGTFCTVDSVLDMLKRQRLTRDEDDNRRDGKVSTEMDVDMEDDWTQRDDIDLIEKSVEDFRSQRLSMVQSLRQFVLCYESVLEWVVREDEKNGGTAKDTKSKEMKGVLGHVPRHSLGG